VAPAITQTKGHTISTIPPNFHRSLEIQMGPVTSAVWEALLPVVPQDTILVTSRITA
jgi:hypothetical protein